MGVSPAPQGNTSPVVIQKIFCALKIKVHCLSCGCVLCFQLRQSLDALLNQLKNFQARLRQYASYEYVQRLLKGYLKVRHPLFSSTDLYATENIDLVSKIFVFLSFFR